jgi:hypothetical protein
VLIRLGKWTNPDQPLNTFIAGELGGLGAYLDVLLTSQRAVLLLDGLNEIPVAQRDIKLQQVQALLREYSRLLVVVTCREQDYKIDLGIERINIAPLDPLRIREFIIHYLGAEQGESLFWRLAGDEARLYELRFRERFSDKLNQWENVFWLEPTLPDDIAWTSEIHNRKTYSWYGWRRVRENPSSLMELARNPYLLLMMTDIYARQGQLPANRGELFNQFVRTLLVREHITDEADGLMKGLSQVAYLMQSHRNTDQTRTAITTIARSDIANLLNNRQLYLANSVSILNVDGSNVRFAHQLLQEYFAAIYLSNVVDETEKISAAELWPKDHWWVRTGWEEVAVLLCGLYSVDCTKVINWIEEANPEVAALCIKNSGAYTPPDVLNRFQTTWVPRLTDVENISRPEARASIGRALGLLNLDNRAGVGLQTNGIPDIQWVEVSAGEFIFQEGQRLTLPTFYIARYPVTFLQYQSFIEADDGITNDQWWDGLTLGYRELDTIEQTFKYSNNPRESISWFHAVAFCRWLSHHLGFEVRLPTDQEWEKAARGTDGRRYPWGAKYLSGYANIDERGIRWGDWAKVGAHTLGQVSAVGIYPQGASPYGVLDMSGNVFDWCVSSADGSSNIRGTQPRTSRGGSFNGHFEYATVLYRDWYIPLNWSDNISFRVATSHPNP